MLRRTFMVLPIILGWLLSAATPSYCANSIVAEGGEMTRGIYLGMPKHELIDQVGAPDQIKSEGRCYAYHTFDISVFLNQRNVVDRIYLGPNFHGAIQPSTAGESSVESLATGSGRPSIGTRVTYSPSPSIQNRATVELEKRVPASSFPLEYRGQGKTYELYGHGRVMKYKYALDQEGIAFYYDQDHNLYATVIYPLKDDQEEPAAAAAATGASAGQRLAPIHFAFDKYYIRKNDLSIINDHVAYMKQHKEARMVIEGHTDYMGSDAYNVSLSDRRSKSAYKYLTSKGVESNRLQRVDYGESRPVAGNKTKKGRALNRRAEFLVFPAP